MGNKVKELEEEIAKLEKEHLENYQNENTDEVDVEEKVEKENEPTPPQEDVTEKEVLTPEEANYKKRYGDLRRHAQKEKESLQAQIDELRQKLERAPQEVPTSEEEIRKWAETNPKAAAIIKAIAGEQATKSSQDLQSKLNQLETAAEEIAKEKERVKIRKKHDDFDEIISSNEFHEWVEKQIPLVQSAVYDGAADDVVWAISLYKSLGTTEDSGKDAAKLVSNKSKTSKPTGEGAGRFSESMVSRMSPEEFEKNEKAIMTAMQSGKFDYDLSAAR